MPATEATPRLAPPVPGGRICSRQWENRGDGIVHLGVDFCAEEGTPILAVADGVVEDIYTTTIGGLTVAVRHASNLWSRHAHCERVLVHAGQTVVRGQQIATVGCTGTSCRSAHLHFGFTRVHYDPGTRIYRDEDVWDVMEVLNRMGIVEGDGRVMVYAPGYPQGGGGGLLGAILLGALAATVYVVVSEVTGLKSAGMAAAILPP